MKFYRVNEHRAFGVEVLENDIPCIKLEQHFTEKPILESGVVSGGVISSMSMIMTFSEVETLLSTYLDYKNALRKTSDMFMGVDDENKIE